MKITDYLKLNVPELTDSPPDITKLSENFPIIDANAKSVGEQIDNLDKDKADLVDGKVPSEQLPSMNYLSPTGDSKDNIVTFIEAITRTNIATGEKVSILFGKIKKYFTDLKTVAFTGSYTDLGDKPTSLPANGGTSSACSGNSATATKLQTARTINGVSFNGTANITVTDGTKAPTNHASTGTGYGVGTTSSYGHCKIENSLTKSSYENGVALSAYQGKVLNDKIYSNNRVPLNVSGGVPINTSAPGITILTFDITKYNTIYSSSWFSLKFDIVGTSLLGFWEDRDDGYAEWKILKLSSTPVSLSYSYFEYPYFTIELNGNIATVKVVNGMSTVQNYDLYVY